MTLDKPTGQTGTPSRDRFLAAAREMIPTLRDRAHRAERERRMPDENHQAFLEAGFYRLFQPARYGGHEMDWRLLVDMNAEIGRGCGSSAWLFSNISAHSWMVGMHHPKAQEDVWGDNPEALIASSNPGAECVATRVEGGLRLDGIWSFASGIDQVDWNALVVNLLQDDGPPEVIFALVPRADYEVVDDWFVNGLAATGSRSLRVRNLFVPQHRILSALDIQGGSTPGSAINSHALFRLPLWTIGPKMFSGVAIGIARGAVDVMEEELRQRRSVGGVQVRDLQSVHLRLAESAADVDAAWSLVGADATEAMSLTEQGREIPLDTRVRWRRNDAYAGRLCMAAVERLYPLAGARGLGIESDFQRAWRDVHAATAQITMSWDIAATNYGKVQMGLPFYDPRMWPRAPGE